MLILHRGEPVSSDRLIDALWEEQAPPSAIKIVQMAKKPGSGPSNIAGLGGASFVVLSLASAMVGAMILWRAPGNAVGWVLAAIGALTGAGLVAYQYSA